MLDVSANSKASTGVQSVCNQRGPVGGWSCAAQDCKLDFAFLEVLAHRCKPRLLLWLSVAVMLFLPAVQPFTGSHNQGFRNSQSTPVNDASACGFRGERTGERAEGYHASCQPGN